MSEAPDQVKWHRLNLVWTLVRPASYSSAAVELVTLLSRRWQLALELAKRDVWMEHTGKALGRFWGVFQPLFLLAVYAFIYSVVFHARIGAVPGAHNYTVYLLSGLVPWFAFQLSMTKATNVLTSHAALVTQVVFDVELLPVATSLAACLPLGLGTGFVVAYLLVVVHTLPLILLALPLLLILQLLAMSGAAFVLASLGTFLHDVRDVVQMSSIVLIFLMPIVYLPRSVPHLFRPLLWFNPFTWMVYCFQDVLFYGRFEHPRAWIAFCLGSLIVFLGGYRLFRKLRPHFANVL